MTLEQIAERLRELLVQAESMTSEQYRDGYCDGLSAARALVRDAISQSTGAGQ